MKRIFKLMDIATDGTASTGMGGGEVSNVTTTTSEPTVTTTESTNNGMMSESDALNFLSGATNQDANTTTEQNPTTTTTTEPEAFNIGEIDMTMFGLSNEPVAPVVPQTTPIVQEQTQTTQLTQEQQQAQMIQDIYNKLNNPNQNEPQIDPEEMTALSALTEKLQKAGLLPKGLSDEDKTLLQEAKAMRDEIKQNKEIQAQKAEFSNKVNAIDTYSKQLEGLIPGYNTEFMISLVSQISKKNPQAGQQILNNPAMLTQLWATYGHKSQPKQQQTNVISSGSGSQVGSTDLFEKIKGGNATIDDEARYLESL